MHCIIQQGAIWWRISTSIEVPCEPVSVTPAIWRHVARYSHFKIHDIENIGQIMIYNTCIRVIWWQKPDFLSDVNNNFWTISSFSRYLCFRCLIYVKFTEYNITNLYKVIPRADILRFERLDLENVCQGREVQHSQWRHSITNTRLPDGNSNFYITSSDYLLKQLLG